MTDNLASAVGELEGTIDVLDMKLAELQKKHSLTDSGFGSWTGCSGGVTRYYLYHSAQT